MIIRTTLSGGMIKVGIRERMVQERAIATKSGSGLLLQSVLI